MTDGSFDGLDWLLDDLRNRLPGADRAIVLSADGLLVGKSSNMHRDDADQLAAVASGFQSLSRSTGRYFGGGAVRRVGTYLTSQPRGDLPVAEAGRGL